VFEFSFPTIKNKFSRRREKEKEKEKKKKNFGGLVLRSGGCLVEEINDQSEASKK
jgi:hypothetical protein